MRLGVPGGLCQINVEMKEREEIMEKVEAGKLTDDLLHTAEMNIYDLMRHSIIPMWKGSAFYRDAMKQLKVNDLEELRGLRHERSRSVNKEEHIQLETA